MHLSTCEIYIASLQDYYLDDLPTQARPKGKSWAVHKRAWQVPRKRTQVRVEALFRTEANPHCPTIKKIRLYFSLSACQMQTKATYLLTYLFCVVVARTRGTKQSHLEAWRRDRRLEKVKVKIKSYIKQVHCRERSARRSKRFYNEYAAFTRSLWMTSSMCLLGLLYLVMIMMMILCRKAGSLAFTPPGDEISEVVSRCLPHRQLWVSNVSKDATFWLQGTEHTHTPPRPCLDYT